MGISISERNKLLCENDGGESLTRNLTEEFEIRRANNLAVVH